MGKRNKRKQDADSQDAPAAPAFHNPFEGLADLRDQLPQGEPSEAEDETGTDSAEGRDPREATGTEPAAGGELAGAGKLVVRREKKGRGGKTVTVVEGLDAATRNELALRLRRELGCGGWVEQERVVLQGAQVERAAEWLRAQGARRVSVSP